MTPMPVSYVPQLSKADFTDKMTFIQRVLNLAAYFVGKLALSIVTDRTMNSLKIEYNIKPERSFQEAAGDAELVLITADFALEYPLPLLPGIQKMIKINIISNEETLFGATPPPPSNLRPQK